MVSSCTRGELRKYRHFGNELPGLETEIEARPDLDFGATQLHFSAQVAVKLGANDSLFEQGTVLHVFTPKPCAVEDAALEVLGIGRVLLTQCLQRRAGHLATPTHQLEQP